MLLLLSSRLWRTSRLALGGWRTKSRSRQWFLSRGHPRLLPPAEIPQGIVERVLGGGRVGSREQLRVARGRAAPGHHIQSQARCDVLDLWCLKQHGRDPEPSTNDHRHDERGEGMLEQQTHERRRGSGTALGASPGSGSLFYRLLAGMDSGQPRRG